RRRRRPTPKETGPTSDGASSGQPPVDERPEDVWRRAAVVAGHVGDDQITMVGELPKEADVPSGSHHDERCRSGADRAGQGLVGPGAQKLPALLTAGANST